MGVVHFLNVNEGDCTWIQHLSGHNTVIDVSSGNADVNLNQVFKIYEQGNHHHRATCPTCNDGAGTSEMPRRRQVC